MCAFTWDGRTLLASGGDDKTVRIWDPATGTEQAALHGHTSPVRAVCAFTLDGRTLLASGSDDGTVRIWDPATGTQQAVLDGHTSPVNARVRVHPGRPHPAGQRQRRQDGADLGPGHRHEQAVLDGHAGRVRAVCAFSLDGRTLLASGSHDNTVRIWDPAAGTQHSLHRDHAGWINAVCAFSRTAAPCWPAAAGTRRCGSGTRPPAPAGRPARPHQLGLCGVRVQPGRPHPAGQRQ